AKLCWPKRSRKVNGLTTLTTISSSHKKHKKGTRGTKNPSPELSTNSTRDKEMKKTGHTIVLGGVGGDAHSGGLTILRQALQGSGYRVRYLGTQTRLEDYFQMATLADAVMISSMDGHGRYYLREFPELMRQYNAGGARWYLGGNLHIGDAVGYE